jgi:feruloyl esterase
MVVVVALLVAALINAAAVASAVGGSAAGGGIRPAVDCSALAGADFSQVPDAPSVIVSAAPTTETVAGSPHTYCSVWGYISPQTYFGIKLPVTGWRGDYVQEGCGGFCGAANLTDVPETASGCRIVDNGQVVLAADDAGHLTSNGLDALWGKDDLALRQVFGRTSEHSLAQIAKAVIARYYGRAPAYSYFDGCSDGGREALMLAQRYPDDFNGIIAGSPAGDFSALMLYQAWLARTNSDPAGHQVLTAEKLPALHDAVIRACGSGTDPNRIVDNPAGCSFDPAALRCPTGTDTPSCLTPAQVDTARALYRGPVGVDGQSLYPSVSVGGQRIGGEPYGSELAWKFWLAQVAADPKAPADTSASLFATNYYRYLAFWPNPPATSRIVDIPLNQQTLTAPTAVGPTLYDADDPDLSAFRAHGGKLLLYHGLADQVIPPWSTVDYYAAVERTAGGFAASQAFSRLYLVPGGYHCLGGLPPTSGTPAAADADFLTPMTNWVEHGQPPAALSLSVPPPTGIGADVAETVTPTDALAHP